MNYGNLADLGKLGLREVLKRMLSTDDVDILYAVVHGLVKLDNFDDESIWHIKLLEGTAEEDFWSVEEIVKDIVLNRGDLNAGQIDEILDLIDEYGDENPECARKLFCAVFVPYYACHVDLCIDLIEEYLYKGSLIKMHNLIVDMDELGDRGGDLEEVFRGVMDKELNFEERFKLVSLLEEWEVGYREDVVRILRNVFGKDGEYSVDKGGRLEEMMERYEL